MVYKFKNLTVKGGLHLTDAELDNIAVNSGNGLLFADDMMSQGVGVHAAGAIVGSVAGRRSNRIEDA